jgi:hypothetical protein
MEKAESSIKEVLNKTTLLELTNDILERAGISTTQSPETITNILLNRKLEYEKNKSSVKV